MADRRVLITGSRNWSDERAIVEALIIEMKKAHLDGGKLVVVHGDCPTGADKIAQDICDKVGIATERHPANWKKHGLAGGPVRNQEMVDSGVDICYAFSKGGSRGTKDCKTRASAAGVEVIERGVV